MRKELVIPLESISLKDIQDVGGKNASIGEMLGNLVKLGIKIPPGFVTTTYAYKLFLQQNNLEQLIKTELDGLVDSDVTKLAVAGKKIRDAILKGNFSADLEKSLKDYYNNLIKLEGAGISFAVRSSATLEDLPDASFAGQQDTVLNVKSFTELIDSIKYVFASLFNDRAISYRARYGMSSAKVLLSVGVQKMIRSDLASSGVIFTLDTDTGFDGVVFITSTYGLGELIVQGTINPDEFYVEKRALANNQAAILSKNLGLKQQKMVYAKENDKKVAIKETLKSEQDSFSLQDSEIVYLAKQALIIEQHYKKPMDIEWAKDGVNNEIYIIQARPETIKSRHNSFSLEKYELQENGKILAEGRSVGTKIGVGKAKLVSSFQDMEHFTANDVLVTDMTDPDWEPIMKKAAAIVTNRGGRTCHAAIIARELGIPAVVGCGNATTKIKEGMDITVSCAQGDAGFVYQGKLKFEHIIADITSLPKLNVKLMMNLANPTQAYLMQQIPNDGVGLARLEFVINQMIGIHPSACLEFAKLSEDVQKQITLKSRGYKTPVDFYRDKLVESIATIGAAFWPKPVIVRFSDFKTNEYANLIGGSGYEMKEENPMIGFRGASRYISKVFSKCFALECEALKKVREEHGLTNIEVMIPFVRTLSETEALIKQLEVNGLKRGVNGLKLIMMCEIPANAILASEFLKYFDGFSIGSNDLTQLTLGVDRDSDVVAQSFNEQDEAVLSLMSAAIKACKSKGKYIGICGQGPSDKKDFAKWLLQHNVDSMSLTPDSILATWKFLSEIGAV